MASNFLKRWSNRTLTAKDKITANTVANTGALSETALLATEPAEEIPPSAPQKSTNLDCNQDVIEGAVNEKSNENIDETVNTTADIECDEALTIADADSVTFDGGVASFLQHGVDKSVKKAALAKLFHSDEFNYISDMDDHTEDFSNIPKLDESVANQLRGWVNKIVDEPELEPGPELEVQSTQDTGEDIELAEVSDIDSIADADVAITAAVVADETAEPIMIDPGLSPCAGESNNHKQTQGETLRD